MPPVNLGTRTLSAGDLAWIAYDPIPFTPAEKYLCALTMTLPFPSTLNGYALFRIRLQVASNPDGVSQESWKFFYVDDAQYFYAPTPLLYFGSGFLILEGRRVLWNNLEPSSNPLDVTLFYDPALTVTVTP